MKKLQYTYCPISHNERQLDNEIWSVNRLTGKIFFFKNHAENEAGRLVPDLFLFF